MDDIDIRQAGVNDCGTILAMLTQLAGELGDGDHFSCRIEDIREHGFGDRSLFQCLIASRDDEDLGLALYFPEFSSFRGKPGVFLQDLWVSASCRDYGVGLKLLQQVALRAEQQWQACYLDLMVHSKNDGAERFYRRHGFVGHSGDQHLFLEGEAFQLLQRAT
jgi:ribosomal protein S18 acetylase RimI-like enzyme